MAPRLTCRTHSETVLTRASGAERPPKQPHKGRFIVRNSWGAGWGEQGYGTLPDEYRERAIADDFRVLTSSEYVTLMGL